MIKIFSDMESMSKAAAGLFTERAKRSIKKNGAFSVALSGGSTPRRLYELLTSSEYADQINWEKADIFWGDERCVSLDDKNSNYRMARESLLEKVPVPERNIHPIECANDPEKGAEEYENLLEKYFRGGKSGFDLILLGLGEDGHTASLFPNTDILLEKKKMTACLNAKKNGFYRVTLTASFINRASLVVFMVSGDSKASMLQRVLEGSEAPRQIPARLINPVDGELIWLADRDAASMLQNQR